MRLEPKRTVFVDVDTQVDFVEPTGALYVPSAEMLKSNFARLVGAARAHGIALIASADAHAEDDPEFRIFPPHCIAGTPGQQRVAETRVPEDAPIVCVGGAAPAGGERTVVIEKVTFDLFSNPAAERVLERTGADTAVVFGVALEYCVRAAALGLRARGYETVLVRDATAPVTADGGAGAEVELAEAGVRSRTTDEILLALADHS